MVTAELSSNQRRQRPRTAYGAAPPQRARRRASALIWGRLRRAVRRQWLLFTALWLLVAATGVAFDYLGSVRIWASLLFWLPAAAGVALATTTIRELGRNTITSLSSFGRHRGYAILGAAPDLSARALRQLPPDRRTPLDSLVFQPSGAFATAFRDLQDGFGKEKVISFVAAVPGEGASTAALCAAASAAQQGRRVVLVDCDLRVRTATRTLVHDAELGVLQASQDLGSWRDMLTEEEETGLHFLPAARPASAWRSLTSGPGFARLIGELRDAYDLVVLDCPPALTSADGPILAGAAQRCVLVTVWDRTPLPTVRAAMRALRVPARLATGVYVNRVPEGYRFGRLRPD